MKFIEKNFNEKEINEIFSFDGEMIIQLSLYFSENQPKKLLISILF